MNNRIAGRKGYEADEVVVKYLSDYYNHVKFKCGESIKTATIIYWHKLGYNNLEIGNALKLSVSYVVDIIQRFRKSYTIVESYTNSIDKSMFELMKMEYLIYKNG